MRKPRVILTDEDRERPHGELAEKYGCTPRTIANARKRQGFPVPVRGKGVSASLSMYLDAADTAVLQAHAGRAGMAPQALLRNKLLELIYTGKTSF
ncbi:MAG: hypothetical protein Q4F72_02815 [Desulfovibrionaceae bacterium]|nr:hypothetical protein [Desulfovibrionaceae bacterium]